MYKISCKIIFLYKYESGKNTFLLTLCYKWVEISKVFPSDVIKSITIICIKV